MRWWSSICAWFGFGPMVEAPVAPTAALAESEYQARAWESERESDEATIGVVEPGIVDSADDDVPAPWWQCPGSGLVEAPRLEVNDLADRSLYHEIQAFLDNPNIELPHLPHVPQRVLTLLRQPMINYADIAKVIAQDQALSASVLRVANSAAYSGTQQVINLETALARLGMKAIQSMMLKESIKAITIKKTSEGRSTAEMLWKKSVAAAVTMEHLAYPFGVRPDEAYLAGLLHDLGEMVLLRLMHNYQKITEQKVSKQVFDFVCQEYHEQMGGVLGEHWNLPGAIRPLLRRHHGPVGQLDPMHTQRCLLQITDMLVSLMGYSEQLPFDVLNSPAAVALGFGKQQSHIDILNRLPELVNRELNLPI